MIFLNSHALRRKKDRAVNQIPALQPAFRRSHLFYSSTDIAGGLNANAMIFLMPRGLATAMQNNDHDAGRAEPQPFPGPPKKCKIILTPLSRRCARTGWLATIKWRLNLDVLVMWFKLHALLDSAANPPLNVNALPSTC